MDIKTIERIVSQVMVIPVSDMHRKCRKRDIVTARQTVYYLAIKYTKLTMVQIAKRYGQDHATVNHSFRQVKNIAEWDRDYASLLSDIETKIAIRSPLYRDFKDYRIIELENYCNSIPQL